jgi:hypothetical protein
LQRRQASTDEADRVLHARRCGGLDSERATHPLNRRQRFSWILPQRRPAVENDGRASRTGAHADEFRRGAGSCGGRRRGGIEDQPGEAGFLATPCENRPWSKRNLLPTRRRHSSWGLRD